jgi:hypothetical protein
MAVVGSKNRIGIAMGCLRKARRESSTGRTRSSRNVQGDSRGIPESVRVDVDQRQAREAMAPVDRADVSADTVGAFGAAGGFADAGSAVGAGKRCRNMGRGLLPAPLSYAQTKERSPGHRLSPGLQ